MGTSFFSRDQRLLAGTGTLWHRQNNRVYRSIYRGLDTLEPIARTSPVTMTPRRAAVNKLRPAERRLQCCRRS